MENAAEHAQTLVFIIRFPMAHVHLYIFRSGVHGRRHAKLIKPTVGTIKDGGSSSFWET